MALTEQGDLNNQTAIGTVAGYDQIVNTNEGYIGIDVNNDTTNEFYYSEWDTNQPTRSINDFYERMKYLSRDTSQYGSPQNTLYGLPGELFRGITHEFTVDTPTGTFSDFEKVTWGAGSPQLNSGQMLAINSTTAATKMWIQLLTGVIPTDGQTITGADSTATVDLELAVNIVPRTLSQPFVGQSTGSAIIGAYGLGIEADDLAATDTVFDLDNVQITPPNNVTFTVFGVVVGEDRILVTNDQASGIDQFQLKLGTTLSTATETSCVVNAAIPTDTPSNGTIRITRDDGLESRHVYSAFSGSTFTIGDVGSPANGYDFSGNNATSAGSPLPGVYVSYIDKLAEATSEFFTVVYLADRTLFIRVRDGGTAGDLEGIKTFETTGTLGNSGGSATSIRTSDV